MFNLTKWSPQSAVEFQYLNKDSFEIVVSTDLLNAFAQCRFASVVNVLLHFLEES